MQLHTDTTHEWESEHTDLLWRIASQWYVGLAWPSKYIKMQRVTTKKALQVSPMYGDDFTSYDVATYFKPVWGTAWDPQTLYFQPKGTF